MHGDDSADTLTARRLEGFSASELLAATPNAVFVVDENWRFTYIDETGEQLLNRKGSDLIGKNLWEEFPEAVGTSFEREYRQAMQCGRPAKFIESYPPLNAWFSVQAVPKQGHLFVFFYDVTEIKEAENRAARIAETHALLGKVATAIAESSDANAIYQLICEETARFLEAHSCWIIGFEDELDEARIVCGNPEDSAIPPETTIPVPAGSALDRVRRDGAMTPEITPLDRHLSGSGYRGALVPVRLLGSVWGAIAIVHGDPKLAETEAMGLMNDLAELLSVALGNVAVIGEMARQAATDPLTGLANLRTLHQELDAAIRDASSGSSGLTFAVVDIDHFKAVNDGLGHEAGDRALETVARNLRESAPDARAIARIGGDEFAILFGTDASWKDVDRVREAIANTDVEGLPAPTVSIGFARWHSGLTRESLQRRADDALYWSKLHGRNACWLFDPTVMERVDPEERAVELRRAGVALDPDHALEAARSANEFWQSTVDALDSHIAVINEDGEIIAVNEAWERFAGENQVDPASVGLGANYLDACAGGATDSIANEVATGLSELLNGSRQSLELEYPCHSPDRERWFIMRANRFPGPRPHRVVIHHEDVTEANRARHRMINQARLLDRVPAAVMATDVSARITYWFRGAQELFGYSSEEAIGESAVDLLTDDPAKTKGIRRNLLAGNDWEGELELRAKSGRHFTAQVNLSSTVDLEGNPAGSLGVAIDVSERQAHLEASELARDYFMAIASSVDEGLITCDTKGRVTFANDAAGIILRRSPQSMTGRKLGELVREPGGDPCPSEIAVNGARRMAGDHFLCGDGTWTTVDWSITELYENPYGDGQVIVFGETSPAERWEERARRRNEGAGWTRRIRTALSENGFALYEQPIVDLAAERTVDRELLIRMLDPEKGVIPPIEFLPAAEEFGLMPQIDGWALDHAVQMASDGLAVHLNLSTQSTTSDEFMDKLERLLGQHDILPRKLTFELTETALIHSTEQVLEFAHRIRELGCCLALDDFGTGYNSLARIKDLPLDELKIDREFTTDVLTGIGSKSVVKTIVALAGELGLRTVAEGVESEAVAIRLHELVVRLAQGYHFGRPAPRESLQLASNL